MTFLLKIAVTCRFIISWVADWLWSQIRTLTTHILFRHVFLASVLLPVYLCTWVHIIILVTPPLIMLRSWGVMENTRFSTPLMRRLHQAEAWYDMISQNIHTCSCIIAWNLFLCPYSHWPNKPNISHLAYSNRMKKKLKDDIIRHILWTAMMQRYLTFEHFPQRFSF
mgnify:CR=1 FL=1